MPNGFTHSVMCEHFSNSQSLACVNEQVTIDEIEKELGHNFHLIDFHLQDEWGTIEATDKAAEYNITMVPSNVYDGGYKAKVGEPLDKESIIETGGRIAHKIALSVDKQIEGDTIYFGIIGNTIGWVAIGFEPTTSMKDADMVFAWVESNGTVVIYDAFSTGNFGPHPPDTDLGGTTNILAFNGSEISGKTIIEFSRRLMTGDQFDNDIPSSGTYNIIWAMGIEDNFGLQHNNRGSSTIDLSTDDVTSTETHTPSFIDSTSTGSESTAGFEVIMVFMALLFVINILRRKFN